VVEADEEVVVGVDEEADVEAAEAIGEIKTRAGTFLSNPHRQPLRPKNTRSSKTKAVSMLTGKQPSLKPVKRATDLTQPNSISDID
jgi:hypothetical protein